MLIAPQITFRGLPHDSRLEQDVLDRIARLEQFYRGIVSCRVLIELPHRHRRDGRHFHVTIELTVPGGDAIVITHEPSQHGRLKDTGGEEHPKSSETDSVRRYERVAVHEAFDAARRRLQDFARCQRKAVKTHEIPSARAAALRRRHV